MKFYYMCVEKCLVVFDVDIKTRSVIRRTVNFDPLWSPFQNYEPNFSDFEEFLESRCFPRYRHNKMMILEQLGIEFYDPWQIVRRTRGIMMHEPCWLLNESDTGDITVELFGGDVSVNAESIRSSCG